MLARCSRHIGRRVSTTTRRCSSVNDDEYRVRCDMAHAHRLCAAYGFDELTWNHISARVDGIEDDFLITPGNRHFSMITPDDMVWAHSPDLQNITANVIHDAILGSRSDIKALVHAHTRAVVFVANLPGDDDPLRFYTQDGGGFYGKVAYHDFEGVANDHEEQKNIRANMGSTAHTLIMRNHGAVTAGASVGEAWVRMFYLDRVCQAQMDIFHAGLANTAETVADSILKEMSVVYEDPAFRHGVEWEAMVEYANASLGPRAPWG